jgi:hypothetical protein
VIEPSEEVKREAIERIRYLEGAAHAMAYPLIERGVEQNIAMRMVRTILYGDLMLSLYESILEGETPVEDVSQFTHGKIGQLIELGLEEDNG